MTLHPFIRTYKDVYYCESCYRKWRRKEPLDPRNEDFLNQHAVSHEIHELDDVGDGSEEHPWGDSQA